MGGSEADDPTGGGGADPWKVFRISHAGTDEDLWQKIKRFREETRDDEHLAMHHVQCMNVQRW
jgi:hypothetical protein